MKTLKFKPEVLREVYLQLGESFGNEMAIPSYLHNNPFITWIVSERMRIVIELLDVKDGDHILDYGCGTGMLLLQLPEGMINYYGVDIVTWPAKKILDAHERQDGRLYSSYEWINSIEEDSIDSIVAIESLEHVSNVQHVVMQFSKLLKPSGKLIITGPTENFFYQIARRIAGFTGEYHLENIYDIISIIETTGFRLEKTPIKIPFHKPFELFLACKFIHNSPRT